MKKSLAKEAFSFKLQVSMLKFLTYAELPTVHKIYFIVLALAFVFTPQITHGAVTTYVDDTALTGQGWTFNETVSSGTRANRIGSCFTPDTNWSNVNTVKFKTSANDDTSRDYANSVNFALRIDRVAGCTGDQVPIETLYVNAVDFTWVTGVATTTLTFPNTNFTSGTSYVVALELLTLTPFDANTLVFGVNGSSITGDSSNHSVIWQDENPGSEYWYTGNNQQLAYGLFYDSDVNPPPTNTRIEWVNPPIQNPSATTTSRTIDFEFNYYLNSSTPSADLYSHILLQLYPLSYPNDPAQRITVIASTTQDSYENVSIEATTLRDGYYLGLVSFWNGESEEDLCDWWEVFGCTDVTVLVGPTFKNNFNSATTTIEADAPPFITQTFSESCDSLDGGGFIDIDAGLCRTFGYLFIPSQDTYSRLSNELNQVLANKKPASYFYEAVAVKDEISNSGATATSNLTLNFGTDVSPFGSSITMFNWENARTGFGNMCDSECANVIVWIEWIFFICFVFMRITKSPDAV